MIQLFCNAATTLMLEFFLDSFVQKSIRKVTVLSADFRSKRRCVLERNFALAHDASHHIIFNVLKLELHTNNRLQPMSYVASVSTFCRRLYARFSKWNDQFLILGPTRGQPTGTWRIGS